MVENACQGQSDVTFLTIAAAPLPAEFGGEPRRSSCTFDVVEERALPGLGRQFSSRRGKLDLFSAGPLLVLRFSGHGEGEFATYILSAFDVILERGERVEMFFEMGTMVNYDSALRTRLTIHFAHHRSRIASLHVFTRSRIVAMGVSVANLALGRLITVHAELRGFTDALDKVARTTRTIGISSSLLSAS